MHIVVKSVQRSERIPAIQFNKNPRLEEGWEVIARKDGYVYIGFNRELAAKQEADRREAILQMHAEHAKAAKDQGRAHGPQDQV